MSLDDLLMHKHIEVYQLTILVSNPMQLGISYQGMYDNITIIVRCSTAKDSLACLRTVPCTGPYNTIAGFRQTPIIDGEFITQLPSQSLRKGQITDVALIIGTNTDEGTAVFWDLN